MLFNYKYLLDYCTLKTAEDACVLDYGCGKGEMVSVGRSNNIDIYGVDIFYKDGGSRNEVEKRGLLGTYVKEINGGKIEFPDQHFDLVVSNQVFEHVDNLDMVLNEISRVLKPKGSLHCLFPVKETWWEGHFGVLFLHLFEPGSKWRYSYAKLWRSLGLGYHHASRSKHDWSKYVCEWVDKYTVYRSLDDVVSLFEKYFINVSFTEDDYLYYRIQNSNIPFKKLLQYCHKMTLGKYILRCIYRKRGGIVITATKRCPELEEV